MLYPVNIEEKLGFDKIREHIKRFCNGAIGRKWVDAIQFTSDYDLIEKELLLTEEFLKILSLPNDFPEGYYIDLRPYFSKARIEGNYLEGEDFVAMKNSLQTLYKILTFFKDKQELYPKLTHLCEDISIPFDLVLALDKTFDDSGKMKNSASPELNRIRQDIFRSESLLRRRMDTQLRELKRKEWVKEDVEITIREGRMVIPLKAEYKRQVNGIIHDSSATGQTVFIEPAEIIEINNEIKELYYEEKREIIRILIGLTEILRPHMDRLEDAYELLGRIDFIRAKARFSREIQAVNPSLIKGSMIKWDRARHPLLQLALKEIGKKIVPHNIRLNHKERILLISGPNAGGKSVALKTVGLVQYMLQCGMLIPVMEGSQAGLFDNVFLDIGDEQSLENDLSTYSSHLKNMKHFLMFANKKTLCLIDEFGTGTEPQLGGAIAEAILESLDRQKAFGVITTHYANLKFLAEKSESIQNAAMLYDATHFEPLFSLDIGQPGSSFALEIAEKIGLPIPLVNRARNLVGGNHIRFEKLNRDLEIERKRFKDQADKLEAREAALKDAEEKYLSLKKKLDEEKKIILQNAKITAQGILKGVNKKIENTIREIKESNAEKEKVKEVRSGLEKMSESLKVKPIEEKPKEDVIKGPIIAGDAVRIKGQTAVGEVLEIRNKEALLQMGNIRTYVQINRLEKISKRTLKKEQQSPAATGGVDIFRMQADFSPEIDLRGKRAEETAYYLISYIDNAIMLGTHHIRVIHGKGNGVLREIVRSTFKKYKQVSHIEDEHADLGGDGVTLITLDYDF